jgi:hypothetical protein
VRQTWSSARTLKACIQFITEHTKRQSSRRNRKTQPLAFAVS